MVPNRLTGELREVDVILCFSTPPGYETVIGGSGARMAAASSPEVSPGLSTLRTSRSS